MKIGFFKLSPVIQPYAWGSRRAIADFLGLPSPSPTPQAELWMGAHPKAPSKILFEGRHQPLDAVIGRFPEAFLGPEALSRFGPRLPYLFKILAADQPLSIQAHPSQPQAQAGFARENAQGIPLSADNRNFKDDGHKPECICAVTSFWGICGFRPFDNMLSMLASVWPDRESGLIEVLSGSRTPAGLRLFFEMLMSLPRQRREPLIESVVAAASDKAFNEPERQWIQKLQSLYPGDIGVISPILLNLFQLQPGEAMFLPAGRLHAYFGGLGIELMANSDNVLRGGLTPKHIDVPQLIDIVDFNPAPPAVLQPVETSPSERIYASPVDEFLLSVVETGKGSVYQCSDEQHSAEIILCSRGEACIRSPEQQLMMLRKGESALIPAAVGPYVIEGDAMLYKASVNLGQRHR